MAVNQGSRNGAGSSAGRRPAARQTGRPGTSAGSRGGMSSGTRQGSNSSRQGSGASRQNYSASRQGSAAARRAAARQQESRKRRKIIIFAVEVIVILIMAAVLYLVLHTTETQPHLTLIDPNNVAIDAGVESETQEGGTMHGYRNIALFGVDAKNEKDLFKSSRSDSIMVASIDMESGDIKLVSVYRDSYLNRGNDTYDKCNGAYAKGGAEQAVRMLNMNLDLDITDFVTVGYAGLAEVIDGLGGVYIDVSEAELQHINNYQYSILGKLAAPYLGGSVPSELNFTPDEYFKDYDLKRVDSPGYQLLDGLQAVAYCRIRYVGNDFERTSRQREVIKAIEAQAKQADVNTLINVFNKAADDIYTNLDEEDILELLPKIANYRIVEESEFPGRDKRYTVNMGAKGSCEVPVDLVQSVEELHEFLFNDADYQVSGTVQEISQQIAADAGKYKK